MPRDPVRFNIDILTDIMGNRWVMQGSGADADIREIPVPDVHVSAEPTPAEPANPPLTDIDFAEMDLQTLNRIREETRTIEALRRRRRTNRGPRQYRPAPGCKAFP